MEEEQDIQSDIVKQKQLRDAQENQEFDRDMDAYRRGRNLTDEQRKKVLLDNARKRHLLGSQLLDNIGGKFTEFGSSVMEAAQDDPDTWTDDAIRIGLGGVKNVGTVLSAPGIKQGLQLLGAPAYYVGRGLGYGFEKAGVDPRYGHIVGEVGEWFIPGYGMYKAAGKVNKYSKIAGTAALSDAAALMVRQNPMYASGTGIIPSGGEIAKQLEIIKKRLLGSVDPNKVTYTTPPLTKDKWVEKVVTGYTFKHPNHNLIASGPKGIAQLQQQGMPMGRSIVLNPGNEGAVMDQIAESIRNHGIDPSLLTNTKRYTKTVKGNPATAYYDYAEQYYAKYGTFEGIDLLELPSGITVQLRTSSIRRRVQSLRADKSKSTGGEILRAGPHRQGLKEAQTQLDILAELREGGIKKGTRKTQAAETIEMAGNDPDKAITALEGHHLAALDRSDYIRAGLPEVELRKMEYYLTSKRGIPQGDNEFNVGWLDAAGVHIPIHKWMDDYLPTPDQKTLQKIRSIKTFEGRKKFLVEWEAAYRKSMEKIYQLQNQWLDYNFPNRYIPEDKRALDIFEMDQYERDLLVDFLEGKIDEIPDVIEHQLLSDPGDPRWPKGPIPTKTETIKGTTKGASGLPGGG